MATINDYSIYCTEEQIKKALKLGASLIFIGMFRYEDDSLPKFVHKNEWNRDEFCYCPTAEQMIGWVDSQGLLVVVTTEYNNYHWEVWEGSHIVDMKETETISSRKEATLVAIDAALDYLLNNKTK